MASIVFNSFWDDVCRGLIPIHSATFKVMLTTSGYTEDKDTHLVRTSVTPEVATGAGYTAGGATPTVTLTKNTANDTEVIALGGATWTTVAASTLTARKAVYYQSVGTAATDRLVCTIDFGTDQVASNGGTLTLAASTITLNNA